jgi:hypothetical protein
VILKKKVCNNLISSGRLDKEGKPLLKALKAKKKKLLYGGEKDGNIYSTSVITYTGLKIYLIMSYSEGYNIIMNTSPSNLSVNIYSIYWIGAI